MALWFFKRLLSIFLKPNLPLFSFPRKRQSDVEVECNLAERRVQLYEDLGQTQEAVEQTCLWGCSFHHFMGELLSAEDIVVLIKHLKSDDEGGSLQSGRKRWSMHFWLLLLLDILMVAKQPAGNHGQLWSQLRFFMSWHLPRATVASLRSTAQPKRNVNCGSQQGWNFVSFALLIKQVEYVYIGLSSCPRVLPTDTWLNWDTRKDFCPAFCLCFLTSLNSLLIIPYILLPCYFIFVLWKAWYLLMVLGHEGKNNFLGTLLLSDWFK